MKDFIISFLLTWIVLGYAFPTKQPECDHSGCIKREAKLRQLIDSTHKDCAWLAK